MRANKSLKKELKKVHHHHMVKARMKQLQLSVNSLATKGNIWPILEKKRVIWVVLGKCSSCFFPYCWLRVQLLLWNEVYSPQQLSETKPWASEIFISRVFCSSSVIIVYFSYGLFLSDIREWFRWFTHLYKIMMLCFLSPLKSVFSSSESRTTALVFFVSLIWSLILWGSFFDMANCSGESSNSTSFISSPFPSICRELLYWSSVSFTSVVFALTWS